MQAREASKAMADYLAHQRAEREKTARLRLLREAKEAADAAAKAAGEVRAKGTAEAKANRMASRQVLGPGKRPAKKRLLSSVGAK